MKKNIITVEYHYYNSIPAFTYISLGCWNELGTLIPGITVEGNIPDMRRLPLSEFLDLNKETSEFKCIGYVFHQIKV